MIEKIKNHLLNGVFLLLLFSSCKKEVSLEIQQDNQVNFNELKSLVTQVKTWHDSTVNSNLFSKSIIYSVPRSSPLFSKLLER